MENPGAKVEQAVEQCLELAQTWLAWDGRPCVSEDGERVYTPHKAVRRIADHVIDHLAEVEALLAGVETIPDEWHASLATFESEFALRIAAAGPDEWDRSRTPSWTLREICEHLTGVLWYAEQVGRLPR
jgi:hypothetical protein